MNDSQKLKIIQKLTDELIEECETLKVNESILESAYEIKHTILDDLK